MIKINIYRKNGKIIRFIVKGHANYGEYGEDIVCSAVTTSATQTLNGILELLKLEPDYVYSEGLIDCNLENIDLKGKEAELNILLESMYKMMEGIAKEYSDKVKIIEKEES